MVGVNDGLLIIKINSGGREGSSSNAEVCEAQHLILVTDLNSLRRDCAAFETYVISRSALSPLYLGSPFSGNKAAVAAADKGVRKLVRRVDISNRNVSVPTHGVKVHGDSDLIKRNHLRGVVSYVAAIRRTLNSSNTERSSIEVRTLLMVCCGEP